MAMARWLRRTGMAASLGLGVAGGMVPAPAWGQVRERDVTITGPRGKTLQRHFESRVTPNGIERETRITRPSGTFEKQVNIQGRPVPSVASQGRVGGPAWRPGPGPGPGFFGPPPVVVRGGGISGAEAFGIGALGAVAGTGATLLLNKALSPPPPPPVYVTPAPVYVEAAPVVVAPAPPPAVVVNPPVRYLQAPRQTLVVDPVVQAIGRLSSYHDNSRKEGALVLGRLGDARAVPPLIDLLKNDRNKEVRIAAATALGEIGDPRGAIVLERAIVYDKKQEVRDAASAALARFPREVPVVDQNPNPNPNLNLNPRAATAANIPLEPAEAVPPPPTPAFPARRN